MYQKVILIGNLGADPEMRYLPSGDPVTSFRMATSEKWNDQSGQLQERTTWWRVSVFGRQAEPVNQYLAKGRQVLVEGTMQADPQTGGPKIFNRQDGTPGASYEIRAINVKFLGQRGEGGGPGAVPREVGEPPAYGGAESEEDLPF
jgi:single-strand DNA-binding protein